jgi:CMP/dCMP kinase
VAIAARDALDSGRAASPLKPAPDAHLLDSTGKSVAEVVAAIVTLAEGRTG